MNLLTETHKAILAAHRTTADVRAVLARDGHESCSWAEFCDLARNVDYDNSYGARHIRRDIVVLFADGSWLRRDEYDGAEWWEHMRPPPVVASPRPITTIWQADL